MTLSVYVAAYLGFGFLLLAWGAVVDIEAGMRVTFLCCLLWPLTLFVGVPIVLLENRGWRMDIVRRRDLSFVGFRRAPAVHAGGWALRFYWVELQVWKEQP